MNEPGLIFFLGILTVFPALAKLSAEVVDWLLSKFNFPRSKTRMREM